MATITAAGIGSGLDVNGILDKIVTAERTPTENRLNLKEAKLQAELTAFGTLKSSVSTFQSSLGKLSDPSLFNSSSVTVSNPDVLTASTSSVAQSGSYSVEVTSLAQSHTLASTEFSSLDAVVGTGTLTFNFGTTDYNPGTSFAAGDDSYNSFTQNPDRSSESIVIDNSNNTLTGVRDAINNASIGVNATIVDNGSGYRLLLTSDKQGADNSMQISVDEGGAAADNIDTTGLSLLAFNSSATNTEQTQAAQNAALSVNGLSISRDSNTVSGAIHGVTLNLLGIAPGQPVQVSVTSDNTQLVEKNISDFVSAYNDMAKTLGEMTAYNVDSSKAGPLNGDATARTLLQQIKRELGGVIHTDGPFNSLSSIGITTNRDGTLTLDSEKLESALSDNFDSVAQLFYANGTVTGTNLSYLNGSPQTQPGSYPVSISTAPTHGSVAGESVTGPITIDSSNDALTISVDGVSTGILNLTQATYTDLTSLAQEIQNRVNNSSAIQTAGLNVSVEYVSGQFQISSSSYGSDSSIGISLENASLGLTSNAVATAGVDVAGSIGSLPSTGSGQLLIGKGDASGLVLQVSGTTTGYRGRVDFSQGIAGGLNALLSQFLAKDGQLDSKTTSINKQIDDITVQRSDLDKRVAAIEARYRTQFAALDVLMGQLQTTSDFLTQQLGSLPVIGQSSSSGN